MSKPYIGKFGEFFCNQEEECNQILETDEGKGSLKLVLALTKLTEQNLDDGDDFDDVDTSKDQTEETDTGDDEVDEIPGLEEVELEKPRFKDMGVKKVFVLAIAPKTPETYLNMKILIEKIKLNKLKNYIMVADLKLVNIILGLGTHSSKLK